MLEIQNNYKNMIKNQIDSFLLHDEILDPKKTEPLLTKYIKKITIYLMNTRYIAQYHVHIIKLITHLIDISW